MIDPETKKLGAELMVASRKSLDKILLEAGMTQEEIQATVEEAMSDIRICGVPLHATECQACQGRGWINPAREKKNG